MPTANHRLAAALLLSALFASAAAEETPLFKVAQPRGAFIAISVRNAASAAQWYVEKLGFTIKKEIGAPVLAGHVVLLEADGALLELLELPDAKPLQAYRPDAAGAYLVHGICKAGFVVEDLDGALKQIQARHIEVRHGPMDVPEFKMRSFIIADLEGNLIQFYGK